MIDLNKLVDFGWNRKFLTNREYADKYNLTPKDLKKFTLIGSIVKVKRDGTFFYLDLPFIPYHDYIKPLLEGIALRTRYLAYDALSKYNYDRSIYLKLKIDGDLPEDKKSENIVPFSQTKLDLISDVRGLSTSFFRHESLPTNIKGVYLVQDVILESDFKGSDLSSTYSALALRLEQYDRFRENYYNNRLFKLVCDVMAVGSTYDYYTLVRVYNVYHDIEEKLKAGAFSGFITNNEVEFLKGNQEGYQAYKSVKRKLRAYIAIT